MNERPDFSIVTPSFNMLGDLQRCVVSVGDQAQVSHEHIIIDGASTDGTAAWLQEQNGLRTVSEADEGMYDAVNKGLCLGEGEYFAYLNCDEQYLPGALASVRSFFEHNPESDIVFGSVLVVNQEGNLISLQKSYPPRQTYIFADHLYLLSCGMFFRRKVVDQEYFFDTYYRDVGDAEFVIRLLGAGFRAGFLSEFVAAFTWTGNNMCSGENARRERIELRGQAPTWVRATRPILNLARRLEKLANGAYSEKMPLQYALYADPAGPRQPFFVQKASTRWSVPVKT